MKMGDNIFITKLPVEGSSESIILHSDWNSDSIRFQVLDLTKKDDNELTGDLLIEDLKTSASELHIPFEDFFAETKQALSKPGGLENFCYAIEDSKFIWRKKDKFKVVYGEVFLLPTKNLKERLILDSIEVINKLRDDYQKLQFKYQKQNVEFETYVESFKECVENKNSLEKNLLTKFCALLNSKKDKIAELQELLKEKNTRFPEERNDLENHKRRDLNQVEEDFVTQTSSHSSRKGLSLPKRKKVLEANNLMQIENERHRPGCSRAITEINGDTITDACDLFDDL